VLNQTSTPVPLRLAKRILAGIIIISSASVASATINRGLQFSYEQGVDTALWRVASITQPQKALAEEAPKKLATTKKKVAVSSYFSKPAKGIDWGILHAHNGVDFANKCGTPITAAADGTVTDLGTGWNHGYGNAVTIKHDNGSETYYAHLTDFAVEVGDDVEQGDTIGTMGISGKATGCHLHFEVHGGKNPFVK
jgi:murein DD-endopeptidase MepM/ murein hydrolase activator NlpD